MTERQARELRIETEALILREGGASMPAGLRSGAVRENMNSTSTGSAGIPHSDVSSILQTQQTPGPLNHTVGSFAETPMGAGPGTSLPVQPLYLDQTHDHRTALIREYDYLYARIQEFGIDHAGADRWHGLIETEFNQILARIEQFRIDVSIHDILDLVDRPDILDAMAHKCKKEWQEREQRDRGSPDLSLNALNLTNR